MDKEELHNQNVSRCCCYCCCWGYFGGGWWPQRWLQQRFWGRGIVKEQSKVPAQHRLQASCEAGDS